MNQEVLALLTLVAGGLFRLLQQWVSIRVAPSKLAAANDLARVAVRAAERIGDTAEEITGTDKYEVASNMLVAAAKRVGLKLKPEEVVGFIHAALREMEQVESLDVGFPHEHGMGFEETA